MAVGRLRDYLLELKKSEKFKKNFYSEKRNLTLQQTAWNQMNKIASSILMIRPVKFGYNNETALTNSYQKKIDTLTQNEISDEAVREFDNFANMLKSKGIEVIVYQDDFPPKPDCVFPNNWISTDTKGNITLYPMEHESRRKERREDIVEDLRKKFKVSEVTDLTANEAENKFLEGTGSMVIDHESNIIYACISSRTDHDLLKRFSDMNNSRMICFNAFDSNGKRIYHTNVMLCIGTGFAVICDKSIKDESERKMVLENLQNSNHEIISITESQMNEFGGNMLMLSNPKGERFIIASALALRAFDKMQIDSLSKFGEIIVAEIPVIETIGGGSARCMIAEIFLEKN